MSNLDVCSCNIIHQDAVNIAKANLKEENTILRLSDIFKVLGDSTRLKIINTLIDNQMCVCDIAAVLNMTHSAVSHQLRVLKTARIVKNRKVGKVVYYTLDDEHVLSLIKLGFDHIDHI